MDAQHQQVIPGFSYNVTPNASSKGAKGQLPSIKHKKDRSVIHPLSNSVNFDMRNAPDRSEGTSTAGKDRYKTQTHASGGIKVRVQSRDLNRTAEAAQVIEEFASSDLVKQSDEQDERSLTAAQRAEEAISNDRKVDTNRLE